MGIRQHRDVTFLEQGVDLDSFGGVPIPQEGQVERSIQQGGDLSRGRQFAQTKFHFWIAAPVTLDGGGKISKHDRTSEADRERPCLPASQPAHLRQVVLNFFDGAPRALGEQVPGQCQLHASRGPIEEAMTDELFQPLDLLAEWRLGNPQNLRRLAEMKRLRQDEKVAKMTKLDLSIHTPII